MSRRQANLDFFEHENLCNTINNGSNTWQPNKIPSVEESNFSWEQHCRRLLNKFVLVEGFGCLELGISEENKV